MKMVKSLLLGSAAGLVAVTAGQAADLPVKARPVQYVKICSLYGAGFYYMPGTDMCLKVGGWMRAEGTFGANSNLAWGPYNANVNDRATNNLVLRARGYITADAREQTAYGVARAYLAVGVSGNDVGNGAGPAFSSNRAFIQWAGFTAGQARSYYDFYNAAVQNYRAGFVPTEDTGDPGWYVIAYTAQLGGGASATISAEDRRQIQIIDQIGSTGVTSTSVGQGSLFATTAGAGYGGWQAPDVVGNIRVDQAWGSAQIMAAAHEDNPLYYGTTETTGGPGQTWGWAVGAGAHIMTPMISPGDYIEGEVNYTVGALKYATASPTTNFDYANGGAQGYGIETDCVYGGTVAAGTGTSCHLTTGWSADLSYEHYWTPQWHESFTGGYLAVNYDSAANAMLCSAEGSGNGAGVGSAAAATGGCNNNFSYWAAGSRLQWDVTKSFYIGVEALYTQLTSASSFNGLVPALAGGTSPSVCGTAAAACSDSNEHAWAFTIRMHKDFLP